MTGNLARRPETCDRQDGTNQEPRQPHAVSLGSFLSDRSARLRERITADRARPAGPWLRAHRMLVVTAILAIAGLAALDSWLATCGYAGCPSAAEIRAYQPSEGGKILDRNDRMIGRLAIVRRVNVPLAAVPKYVQDAFIATEDRRFYEHNGLDWRGMFRATVRNVGALGVREGFSTITMQVVRNSFLADRYRGRSFRRKLLELRMTRLLEAELTKDQILEHYLNVIYLGNGVNGVEAASRDLFGKSVDKLTVSEGAMLAALPKGPSVYTPRRSPERALRRRNLVLGLMADAGYLTADQAARAQAQPLRIAEEEWRPTPPSQEPSALDAVRALVDSVLPDALREGDVVVRTTLDFGLQRAADRSISRNAQAITAETRDWYGGVQDPAQGAYVALDPATGDIRALVGTAHHTQRGGFNRAYSAKRQPGSAFKPFVYAAAIAAGLSPAAIVDDDPVEVQIGRQVWRPSNYGDEYAGPVTLRRALELSANAATVRVSRTVGESRVIAAARRNGITSPLPAVPSLALGAVEVTPIELIAAYAPFANGGRRVVPRLVRRIESPDGQVLWSQETQTQPVMDPRDAYEVTSMLRAVVDFGTGRTIRDYGIDGPVAGKTGTTNNGDDVWFVGYTPSLVAGVWFGYDTPRPIAGNAAGGRLAAPAWAEAYRSGWREPPNSQWVAPDGMVSVVIDPESGQLATDWCPNRVREWFKPGTEPRDECSLHTGPTQDPMADAGQGADQNTDPITKAGRGLGAMLKRIFHF